MAKDKVAQEEQEVTIESLQAELAEAHATIAELGEKLTLVEAHKAENVNVVKIGKQSYKLLGDRFVSHGVELNAKELMNDQKELERLVEIGSGSLVAID
jgi:uncharacterized coiled-coil protein SlyX